MLATVVVSGLYILITPVFNIIYPRFSTFVAKGDLDSLKKQYRLGTRLLASVLFPAAMLLSVFAEDIVYVWTGNHKVATSTAPIIALLASGSALHGVMHFPYALQLAYGATRLSLTIYAVLIVVMLPLFAFLPLVFGTVGGGAAWLAVLIFYTLFGTWYMHRHLFSGEGVRWLGREVGLPLVLSVAFGAIVHQGLLNNAASWHLKWIICVVLGLLLPSLSILTSNEFRRMTMAAVQGKFN